MIPCQIAGRSWLPQGEPEARLEMLLSAVSDPAHPSAAWALLCPGLKSPLCWAQSSPLYGPRPPVVRAKASLHRQGHGDSSLQEGRWLLSWSGWTWGLGRVAVDSGS